ncbi:MAG: class II aldolase/adducin family protein [Chloroflexi bacterium]|nr:class II aldolase/adducin family protein [Chloroflexota bacterium]
MSDARRRARAAVLRFGRRMQAERLVYWTSGNLSVRVEGEPGLVAMSPTALPYDEIEFEDVPLVTLAGHVVEGRHAPTSELPLHTLLYERRPEIGAIVHTHSAAAMSMAALDWTMPAFLTGLVEATGGDVPCAPYARPGTAALADAVAAALADRGACFLRHHGLLAIGATLPRAFQAATVTEGAADAYLRARAVAGRDAIASLPPDEIAWIAEAWRAQWTGAETGARG